MKNCSFRNSMFGCYYPDCFCEESNNQNLLNMCKVKVDFKSLINGHSKPSLKLQLLVRIYEIETGNHDFTKFIQEQIKKELIRTDL